MSDCLVEHLTDLVLNYKEQLNTSRALCDRVTEQLQSITNDIRIIRDERNDYADKLAASRNKGGPLDMDEMLKAAFDIWEHQKKTCEANASPLIDSIKEFRTRYNTGLRVSKMFIDYAKAATSNT